MGLPVEIEDIDVPTLTTFDSDFRVERSPISCFI